MSRIEATAHHARARSLEQAASVIFALTALVPSLIFLWILSSLDAMGHLRVQIGLGLSLAISVLGFGVLRSTMRRTSEAIQLLVRAEMATEGSLAPAAQPAPSEDGQSVEVDRTPSGQRRVRNGAIGSIRELQDVAELVARRWRRQAEGLIGRRVVVSVMNLEVPETGTLARITEDGLVLENDGQEFGVLWRLISSVEAEPAAEEIAAPSA